MAKATGTGLPMTSALTKRQRMELQRSEMIEDRQSFLSHWRDLNNFVSPRKARFQINDNNRGGSRMSNIVDSTATFALRTLSAGMMGGLTSPARPWFKLTTPDPDLAEFGPVKEYLHIVAQRMATVFLKSNLYKTLPIIYSNIGLFGTAAMGVFSDSKKVIRCHSFPVGSYMIANDEDYEVKIFGRDFQMTVRQIVEKFVPKEIRSDVTQWTNVSEAVQSLWSAGQFQKKVDVTHMITPNSDYNGIIQTGKYKKYASCYFERGAQGQGNTKLGDREEFLQEGGFDNFPILVPRWEVTGEDIYATDCPGMTVLGDIKQLQLQAKRIAQAIDKIVSPPMTAPTALKNGRPTSLPSDITYLDVREGQRGFEPAYEVDPRVLALSDLQKEIRYMIRRGFYEDLFLMMASNRDLDRGDKTAREIEERHEEKLIALGPVLGQLDQDLLNPLIDLTYYHMDQQGLLPEPPQELQGQDLKVEYLSLMAVAQKMVGISGLERFATFGVQLANTSKNPDVLDKIDFDNVMDEHAMMTGVPPRCVVPDELVKERREARQKQMAAAQEAATLKDATAAAKNLAGSPTTGGNALSDLVGAGGLPTEGVANALPA